MNLYQRLKHAEKLEKRGQLKIGKDVCIVKNGLVHVKTETQPMHPRYNYPLENPMTWDTFTHLYLLDK